MFRKMATSNREEIGKALKTVLENIQRATDARPKSLPQISPRLVAVSKTKPATDVFAAYECGQRHFGENYVNELDQKSRNPTVQEKCPDIRWHFIGHLQRNKANKVVVLPNLYMVETVDSQKLAQTLNNHWEKYKRPGKLKVMVQVNTSGEDSKSGCSPNIVPELTTFIRDKCPCLEFAGLMTIGAYGYDPADGPNPDFLSLVKQREDLCKALSIDPSQVELSMGMSTDYEHAIELGSTNIRIGSTIFGARNVPPKPETGAGDVSGSQPQSESSQSQGSQSSKTDSSIQSINKCNQMVEESSQSESRNVNISQSEETGASGHSNLVKENDCDDYNDEHQVSMNNLSLH